MGQLIVVFSGGCDVETFGVPTRQQAEKELEYWVDRRWSRCGYEPERAYYVEDDGVLDVKAVFAQVRAEEAKRQAEHERNQRRKQYDALRAEFEAKDEQED